MTSVQHQLEVLSVAAYAARLARAVREVGGAVLEGEVQRPRRSESGMLWFSLTDGEATLSCKVFRNEATRLEHVPRDGDLVQVTVQRPDLWAQSGRLDLIAVQIRLAGEGELLRRRRELLQRLRAEGLCDPARRRPLPRFPRAVGVIAGAGSDGMSDVLRALRDRWPAVEVVTCASLVQGRRAPHSLIDALARLQEHPRVDVIVLARGGGSVQDLACFDDERLCRALFACALPVVCAIGHTDNNPVCNHVCWAAYTPSRSAELVVPSAAELRERIATAAERLAAVPGRLELAAERVARGRARIERTAGLAQDKQSELQRLTGDACAALQRRLEQAGELARRERELMADSARRCLDQAARDVGHNAALVAARDFRSRGWLLASLRDGTPVSSVCQLARGTELDLHLRDGLAGARIEGVSEIERRP